MAIGTNLAKCLHYDQNPPLTKTQRSSITMKWFCWKLQKKDVFQVVVFPSPSYVWLFVTPQTAAHQASLSLTISQSLPKFMFIASVMLSSHLILWCPLFLLPLIFPSIRDFPMSRLFTSDDQNTGASASASVLPVNIQGWSPLRLTGLISLLFKGLSGVFSTAVWRQQFFGVLPPLQSSSPNHSWPRRRP